MARTTNTLKNIYNMMTSSCSLVMTKSRLWPPSCVEPFTCCFKSIDTSKSRNSQALGSIVSFTSMFKSPVTINGQAII